MYIYRLSVLISLEYNLDKGGSTPQIISYVTALIAKDSDVRLARLLVELDRFKLLDSTYVISLSVQHR